MNQHSKNIMYSQTTYRNNELSCVMSYATFYLCKVRDLSMCSGVPDCPHYSLIRQFKSNTGFTETEGVRLRQFHCTFKYWPVHLEVSLICVTSFSNQTENTFSQN